MSFSNILVIVSPFPMSQTGSQPTAEGFHGQSEKLIFSLLKKLLCHDTLKNPLKIQNRGEDFLTEEF